mmetsp:Transcript_7426/g.27773  ORF Transcript_7426/g.27773 Transcript_7426/m.27773 type:complete len:259 (+) Transcript_7426:352-1128(+)
MLFLLLIDNLVTFLAQLGDTQFHHAHESIQIKEAKFFFEMAWHHHTHSIRILNNCEILFATITATTFPNHTPVTITGFGPCIFVFRVFQSILHLAATVFSGTLHPHWKFDCFLICVFCNGVVGVLIVLASQFANILFILVLVLGETPSVLIRIVVVLAFSSFSRVTSLHFLAVTVGILGFSVIRFISENSLLLATHTIALTLFVLFPSLQTMSLSNHMRNLLLLTIFVDERHGSFLVVSSSTHLHHIVVVFLFVPSIV